MKKLLYGLALITSMSSYAEAFLVNSEVYSGNRSGRVVKEFPNGELKIKDSISKKFFYSFPNELIRKVADSEGYSKGTSVKFISGSGYLYGVVSSVFADDSDTFIKVNFEGSKYPSYLRVQDFSGKYSHILVKGCRSYKGAKIGQTLENEDGQRIIKYIFSDNSVVLEKRFTGGRSYHLADLGDIGYHSEFACI